MSRSGYSDSCDGWNLVRWRGAVTRAIRGHRGQSLLRELLAALEALPSKRLVSGELVTRDGQCCALGAVALARGMTTDGLDPFDRDGVAAAFGVAPALAAEIAFENDEQYWNATPEQRYAHMLKWVRSQLTSEEPP